MPKITKTKRDQLQRMRKCHEIMSLRKQNRVNNPDTERAEEVPSTSTSFQQWAGTAAPPGSSQETTSTLLENTPNVEIPTININVQPIVPPKSFREWVAASSTLDKDSTSILIPLTTVNPAYVSELSQAGTSFTLEKPEEFNSNPSGEGPSMLRSLLTEELPLKPAQAVCLPSSSQLAVNVASDPLSTEPELIRLSNPDNLHTIVKEECVAISDEGNLHETCYVSQPMKIYSENTINRKATTSNKKIRVSKRVKLLQKRKIELEAYIKKKNEERYLKLKKLEAKRKAEEEMQNACAICKRKRNRKNASTTTADLVVLKNESTSTDDPIEIKQERDETEELKLFFQLCDKYLDTETSDMVKVTASSYSKTDWLIVTDE